MTEEEIKRATCQVVGKDEVGTGWLISANLVLTAYHCVEAAVTAGEPVVVRFGTGTAAIEHTAAAGPCDEDLDVCLLQLLAPLPFEPIRIDAEGLRPGEKWNAFGYPVAKMQLGHVVRGEIQQVLAERVHRMDLDLSVEPGTHLSNYKGLSGSALMVGSVCKGLLRLNIDSALGAVSFEKLKAFLEANALLPQEPLSGNAAQDFGTRPAFDELFESSIEKKGAGYLFLEGSHGVGKSTYCSMFSPQSPALENLGVYHFTDRASGATPAQQVQPEVFFDWANSLLSTRATGRPARLMDLTYGQLIERTGEVLKSLAARSKKAGKTGVLFIDGINEAAFAGDETLRRFVGLLPQRVPDGLVIVITGVGLDSLAASLGPILHGAERLTLPTLERDVQYGVCTGFLDDDKVTTQIVAALCDRAKGHPLYLRYLADLVNSGASEVDIAELPVFSGAIEDYYETIWSKLALDSDIVNLLGIIARLRGGIPVATLTCMLSPAELAVLPSTLLRVRHLLASPENTAIYHPSFSQFAVYKTALIGEWVHIRLVGFCTASQSGDYGVLNKVYHALRGGDQQQLQAIAHCQQAWVDDSVLRGAEPDVLLSDIDETLAAATRVGTALDIIRLLLLSQRLTFRYDVLFVQSAELVASALVALGKTESALRHVVRNGRLVVSADEAFSVACALTQRGSTELALDVLELVQREINVVFDKMRSGDGVSRQEFLTATKLRIHAFSLTRAAGDDPPFTRFLRAIIQGVLRGPDSQFSPEEGAEIVRELSGEMAGAQLCLKAEYRPFSELKLSMDVDLSHLLLIFLQTLAHAQMYSELYGIALNQNMVALLLEDIARVIDAPLETDDRRIFFTDALIEAGATPSLVKTYSAGVDLGNGTLTFYKKNRSDPDESGFDDAIRQLRASAFLDDGYTTPSVRTPTVDDWEQDLQVLAQALAWCDGKARRAFATGDQPALDVVWSCVAEDLLPSLAFTFETRIHWDSSYLLPEAVVPRLYERLAKLLLDCFSAKAVVLLDALERGFDIQLGLYNEGFRKTLAQVLRLFIERMSGTPSAGKIFTLVMRWRDYAATNVENRFELIPELLQIVPLLARLHADEEALRTYRMVLSFSMGPSWYKEDQLSMMTSTLEALPAASPVAGTSLAQIAALLERATGEMTFQRYVRADKGNYIGELCRRSLFSDAIRYFQHQSCGTLNELFAQATSGNLDRVSTLVGMRFPGAALEEQAALLAILRKVGAQASWQLRWALLEVYQHGDERHLRDWGRQYAGIISELVDRPDDLALASARVRSIVASLNDERAWLLLRSLVSSLAPESRSPFEPYIEAARSKLEPQQVQQLTSSFGLPHEEDEKQHRKAATKSRTGNDAQADDDDDRFVLPGTFGKRSAVQPANAHLEAARDQLTKRNFAAAVQESLHALKTLQTAGWSIWADNHSARFADELISAQVQSADELARLYGPLALDERHTQRWRIASHLISLVGEKVTA
ncbi:AVAST type 1 anti-phage system protease Avs1b [Variovorax ureilyticus]|uniref:AVAST type 1 anti-phage system protease Avs1b n=1 Tax=Variovorax ureilyticus TaxID=1836198 RepID=UPI003D67D788